MITKKSKRLEQGTEDLVEALRTLKASSSPAEASKIPEEALWWWYKSQALEKQIDFQKELISGRLEIWGELEVYLESQSEEALSKQARALLQKMKKNLQFRIDMENRRDCEHVNRKWSLQVPPQLLEKPNDVKTPSRTTTTTTSKIPNIKQHSQNLKQEVMKLENSYKTLMKSFNSDGCVDFLQTLDVAIKDIKRELAMMECKLERNKC